MNSHGDERIDNRVNFYGDCPRCHFRFHVVDVRKLCVIKTINPGIGGDTDTWLKDFFEPQITIAAHCPKCDKITKLGKISYDLSEPTKRRRAVAQDEQ